MLPTWEISLNSKRRRQIILSKVTYCLWVGKGSGMYKFFDWLPCNVVEYSNLMQDTKGKKKVNINGAYIYAGK